VSLELLSEDLKLRAKINSIYFCLGKMFNAKKGRYRCSVVMVYGKNSEYVLYRTSWDSLVTVISDAKRKIAKDGYDICGSTAYVEFRVERWPGRVVITWVDDYDNSDGSDFEPDC